ncbi:MAG: amino acid ABC transporter permease [Candidatus Ancillula sp.]|nr:amino acid ABC transporter permease [Candidatus Ancillula sp.]
MKKWNNRQNIKNNLITGIAIIIFLYLGLSFVSDAVSNKQYHWDIVWQYLFAPKIMMGLVWTLILTFSSMIIAIILAVLLALGSKGKSKPVKWFCTGYIWLFRGTPIYTQLIFWGLIAVLWPKISLGIPFTDVRFFELDTTTVFSAVVAAILGLALNEAAYLSEIVRAGIDSVSVGQYEAGEAIGLSRNQTMFKIILPQAMRVIIPPTGNETISMLKTTSLVVAIPFTMDLNYVQGAIANRIFLPIPMLIVACFWYLLVSTIFMFLQSRLEKHFGKSVISVA